MLVWALLCGRECHWSAAETRNDEKRAADLGFSRKSLDAGVKRQSRRRDSRSEEVQHAPLGTAVGQGRPLKRRGDGRRPGTLSRG